MTQEVICARTWVTPQQARAWLQNNDLNRQISKTRVERYSADMRAGRWELNNDAIAISEDGVLQNGQHRLEAVILFGHPVEMMVTTGLSRNAYVTMDAGKGRTVADTLHIKGYSNSVLLAATAKIALQFSTGVQMRTSHNRLDVLAFAEAHTERLEAAMALTHEVSKRSGLTPSPMAAVAYLASLDGKYQRQLAAFFEVVRTGLGTSEYDPRVRLRDWAIAERVKSRGELQAGICFSGIVRAWNAFVRGEELRMIRPIVAPTRDNLKIVGFPYSAPRAPVDPAFEAPLVRAPFLVAADEMAEA